MHRRTFSRALGGAAFVMVCAAAVPAFSQTDEQRAGARSLATEGASAFNDGRYKDAVDLFSKAESLVHAPPHLLFMARAHAKLGQFVKAREAYIKISREQLAPNAPQAFRDAQTAASREVSAIDPKIGGLAIKVEGSESAKDLQVRVDGTLIPAVLVGVSQPVDPGEHRIEAVAVGFRAQPRSLKVGEGEKTSVTLKLEADATAAPIGVTPPVPAPGETGPGAPGAVPPGQTLPGASGSTTSPPPADTGSSGGSGMRIGAYSAFGIGAVGIGLGTVFLLKSGSDRAKADDICNLPGGVCPDTRKAEVEQADNDANSARTVGVIGLVVGGLAVGAGVALLVFDKKASTSAGTTIRPWVGIGSAGVAGQF